MRQAQALDLSMLRIPDPGWVERRRAEGVEVIFQCAWTGGYQSNDRIREVCAHNLRMIREGGCRPALYTNAAPWRTPQLWYDETLRNAGAELVNCQLVLVDIEIADGDLYIVPEQALAFIEMWERDFPTWTYSADWYVERWKLAVGDANRVYLDRPYLHARYDGIADLTINPPRHPLGPLAGKQYRGSHDLEGVTVDASVIDMDLIAEEEEMPKIFIGPGGGAVLESGLPVQGQDSLDAVLAAGYERVDVADEVVFAMGMTWHRLQTPDLTQVTDEELLAEVQRRLTDK